MRAESISIDHRRHRPPTETEYTVAPLLRRPSNTDDLSKKPVDARDPFPLLAKSIDQYQLLPRRTPDPSLLKSSDSRISDIDAILAANTAAPVDVGLPDRFNTDTRPPTFAPTEDTLVDQPKTPRGDSLYLAPIDSSSLVAEATVAAEASPSSEAKLRRLAFHQAKLYEALGQSYSRDDLLYRSFNAAKDVTKLELAEDEDAYTREVRMLRLNLKTNLVERLKADTVLITYAIEDGKVFAELPGVEPGAEKSKVLVSQMIQEGIDYRLEHGTVESEREQAELDGWLRLEAKLADPRTEVGATFTVFSPKSSVIKKGEKGAYDKSFINKYIVREKNGQRQVELVQRDVDLDEQGYRDAAESLDPDFFAQYDQADEKPPLDAYYLARPVQGELPLALTEGKRMSLHTFESKNMYNDPLLQGMIDYYIAGVEAAVKGLPDTPDWKDLCVRFNAILNLSDKLEKKVKEAASYKEKVYQVYPQAPNTEPVSMWQVQAAVQMMGRQTPQEKGGAGCPTNKGYDLGNNAISSQFPGGSVAGFSSPLLGGGSAETDQYGGLTFNCPHCNSENRRPKGKLIQYCQNETCKKDVTC